MDLSDLHGYVVDLIFKVHLTLPFRGKGNKQNIKPDSLQAMNVGIQI